ncbi:TPM domain-containing protein [Sphingobium sp. AR-3-1]|uniref:TPM domain-containing protein n=1 Tax=Sphingobium psychrophilum TaxID=2728834 RepID=A0A7X9WWK5_9SPHN|nr:TPM domain-containing protein [Sphingobium psychrophilum]NML11222.1 TPM domain-containing protein [Sphingobium psychrophilum]
MKAIFLLMLAATASCSDGKATNQSPSSNRLDASDSAPASVALRGRVTDDADILNPEQEASLSTRLQAFEEASGHQMVVVTVQSLGGRDVAVFTKELGNTWGIGRAEQDDGIILLVAPKEHKARIEVGLGLERTLPNNLCKQIMDTEIIPHFRNGDYPSGISAGVTAVIAHAS